MSLPLACSDRSVSIQQRCKEGSQILGELSARKQFRSWTDLDGEYLLCELLSRVPWIEKYECSPCSAFSPSMPASWENPPLIFFALSKEMKIGITSHPPS